MLSIVIPTKNEAKFLPTLIRSIKDQNYNDYEIIIADNQSTDATREIAYNFDLLTVDGGLPGAGRNRGAENISVHSDIIIFLDSDVVLKDQNFLLNVAREFRTKNISVATVEILPLSDKKFDKFFHWLYNKFVKLTANSVPHAAGSCIIVDPIVHKAINGFDEEIMLAEDSDYVFRASKHGKFAVLNSSIFVSTRRLDKDGRLKILVKYVLAGIHLRIFGNIKSDLFNYKFAHYHDK